jgi:hypothetical protein
VSFHVVTRRFHLLIPIIDFSSIIFLGGCCNTLQYHLRRTVHQLIPFSSNFSTNCVSNSLIYFGYRPDVPGAPLKDDFRKPIWTDGFDTDDDDDLFERNRKFFSFHMFTNPLELQKHFEQQMQEVMKSLGEDGQLADYDVRDEYLKPGFENEIMQELRKQKAIDTDLDDEWVEDCEASEKVSNYLAFIFRIYADQLHSLLQRMSPDLKAMLPSKMEDKNRVLTDDEKIMDRLIGRKPDESVAETKPKRSLAKPNQTPSGVFGGSFQGPKMFGQSVVSHTVRRPDGTYETRKTVRDSDGNAKTTVIRSTADGRVEKITSDGDTGSKLVDEVRRFAVDSNDKPIVDFDSRYYALHKGGYTLPKNIW